jgi:hypothetical protein
MNKPQMISIPLIHMEHLLAGVRQHVKEAPAVIPYFALVEARVKDAPLHCINKIVRNK